MKNFNDFINETAIRRSTMQFGNKIWSGSELTHLKNKIIYYKPLMLSIIDALKMEINTMKTPWLNFEEAELFENEPEAYKVAQEFLDEDAHDSDEILNSYGLRTDKDDYTTIMFTSKKLKDLKSKK